MIDLNDLKRHIRTLVTDEPTESHVLSCYLNVKVGEPSYRPVLDERVEAIRRSLPADAQSAFEEAVQRIRSYLSSGLMPLTQGVALFARGGSKPFFLPLQFGVKLPNWIALHPTPNVFHLVELKDNYHRYVVLVSDQRMARIFEVNLGAVTEELWWQQPQLRERVESGWSREQYIHHREKQTETFIQEKIKLLDRLMSAGGHSHLILAGDPKMTERIRAALPKHLAAKLADIVTASPSASTPRVVAETLARFCEYEEREDLALLEQILYEMRTSSLAVAGVAPALRALHWGQADALVISKSLPPGSGWVCNRCGAAHAGASKPADCDACHGSTGFHKTELKEAMARLAEKHGCRVSVVGDSERLRALGGVACLLRYLGSEHNLG